MGQVKSVIYSYPCLQWWYAISCCWKCRRLVFGCSRGDNHYEKWLVHNVWSTIESPVDNQPKELVRYVLQKYYHSSVRVQWSNEHSSFSDTHTHMTHLPTCGSIPTPQLGGRTCAWRPIPSPPYPHARNPSPGIAAGRASSFRGGHAALPCWRGNNWSMTNGCSCVTAMVAVTMVLMILMVWNVVKAINQLVIVLTVEEEVAVARLDKAVARLEMDVYVYWCS